MKGKVEFCQECQEQVIYGFDDDQTEEINPVTPVRNVKLPSLAEIEEHNLTHLPFRDWCEFCVQGKASSHPHMRRKVTENEVPVIAMDYMGLKQRNPEEGKAQIIVIVDRNTKTKLAHVLKSKGGDDYAIERVAKEIMSLGYSKFVIKTDQEPAIKTLRDSVMRRITALRGEVDMQIIPEEYQ